ncbi:alkaline phosphatase family protein [Frankia sp. CNm7]|uniref:Alkaline phosphatase family protein n=1 Tax=Frankia nepalensis TaxID=1836974 RepID=A0A937RJX6_9ACTN|nr:alkaline phosphatase D family protein [Frankia nepalensis]MBL7499506.1 alkaline phosphatase family protein [Frankia nepalensis]MBL7514895.1 alkaline phosphatase family protein [Frankia nepalensis]MBL7524939.1 alkaline phosphatase family protein [Frankia nepalensis]MBL7633651.1 alkaline phosphatase family protein [Frankia nepalensis]
MASLLLGPMHRFADAGRVTVWVETDVPGDVEVRTADGPRASSRTFAVAGHHFALVTVDGLVAGRVYPYEVWLAPAEEPSEDTRVWPEPGAAGPPSLLRPVGGDQPVQLVFGSCRVTAPQAKPYTLNSTEDPKGLGTDALHALALRMAETDPDTWPDALLLLGDQVYADHVSPETAARIRERRDVTQPPGEEIADFTEYCWLYQEAWSQPEIRWLLSTVPTAMIADDHDVRDDWNISASWRAWILAQPWWDARVTGGIMAYWLYQHLGNLDPETRAADPVWRAVADLAAQGEDAEEVLRVFARRADRLADRGTPVGDGPDGDGDSGGIPGSPRWSYRWDLGRTRLIVIDSRLGRVVAADGTRRMVNDAAWSWIEEQTRHSGEVDHLLLGTSVPFLLTDMIHNVEAATERVAAGRFGRVVAAGAERVRRTLDLEHWAAFDHSFRKMSQLLTAVATGGHGPVPASVVVLSGDVHHAYLARVHADGDAAPIWQAVCSPFRNPLGPGIRRVDSISRRRFPAAVSGRLARLLGAKASPLDWTVTHGPWFDSQLATLRLDGRTATLLLEKTEPDGEPGGLDEVLRAPLT